MSISQYWVGQIPAKPIPFVVRDSDGRQLNLTNYTDFNVKLIGSDNEEIDVSDAILSTAGAASGRFVFRFPANRSVFNKSGEYLLQLELIGTGVRDFTTAHTIKVRRLGGIN